MTFPRFICPAMVGLLSLFPLLHQTVLRSQDHAAEDEPESSLALFPIPGMSGWKKEKEPDQKTTVETVVATALPSGLTENFPVGRMFHGVMIPSYTDDVLKSVMRADTVVRVDETYLDLTNLTVQVYNAKGKPETTISMAEASYDLALGELASKTPSRIEQPRFTMTGQKLIYQSASRLAIMKGNVRLVVPDVGGLIPEGGIPGTGK